MHANDLSAVLTLAAQLGHPSILFDLESRFRILQNDTTSGLFVGVIENEVMAFMQLSHATTLMSGARAELNALVVLDTYRSRGYGRHMLEYAFGWARERGLPKIRLGSRTQRTEAHRFYERAGFTVEKSWLVFSKPV
jgi:GNAT superfamily N-acetyltransferase